MSTNKHSFSILLLGISVALVLISYGVSRVLPTEWQTNTWLYQITYFFAATFLILRILSKDIHNKGGKFVRNFMLTTSFKFLFNISIALAFAFLLREQAKGFLVHFMFYYMIYTFAEIAFITISGKQKA